MPDDAEGAEESWDVNGLTLTRGAHVRVDGQRGDYRFLGLQTNERTGETWVNLYGGLSGRERSRSFDPSKIRLPPRRRRRS